MNKDTLASEVASRLRAERARADLTLRDAGARSGVHYMTISRCERGDLPTLETLYKLAAAYGVEAAALLPPMATLADVEKASPKKGKKS